MRRKTTHNRTLAKAPVRAEEDASRADTDVSRLRAERNYPKRHAGNAPSRPAIARAAPVDSAAMESHCPQKSRAFIPPFTRSVLLKTMIALSEPGPVLRGLIEKDENAVIDRLHQSGRKTNFIAGVSCSQAAHDAIALGGNAILSNGSEAQCFYSLAPVQNPVPSTCSHGTRR